MYSRLGVQVFPTEYSRANLYSPNLFHFSPSPEPPVDYSIKGKPKRRPDYSVSLDVFRKDLTPNYEGEEDALRTPLMSRRPRMDRRSTQVVGDVLAGRTHVETTKILEELDATLENEVRPSRTNESRFLTPRRRRSLERVKSLAEKGQQTQIAPIMKTEVIEDLKKVARGQGVAAVNEDRQRVVVEMYEKTRRLIEEARDTYTYLYFLPKYDERPIPQWQKQLLASKSSRETLRQYEEKAWTEFDEWKRRCAPQVQLQPDYRFALRPTLN